MRLTCLVLSAYEDDVPHGGPYVLFDNPQILLQTVNDVEGGMMA